ncbi:MAG: hypothetical protein WCP77_06565 [Roseococcus sp.]
MKHASRRAVLATGLSVPGLARAQTAAPGPPPLRVLVAAESPDPLRQVVRDFGMERLGGITVAAAPPTSIGGPFAAGTLAGQALADVVLTDNVGLVLGAVQQIWQPLPEQLREMGGSLMARRNGLMLPLAGEIATVVSAAPGGPLLLHRTAQMPRAPNNATALMDFARERPRRFLYPRPGESLLGLQFVSALPYLLNDADPKDPVNGWERSWAFLAEIGEYVSFYASSSAAAVDELASGRCDLLPAILTTYLRERANARLPAEVGFTLFDDGPLVPLGLFLTVPRPVLGQRLPMIGELADFLLRPEIQRVGFGAGLLPGAAAELGVAADGLLTPAERAAWDVLLPPITAESVAAKPLVPPLTPLKLAYMLQRWDEQIGARFRRPR